MIPVFQLALPPAPEMKLLCAPAYAIGGDLVIGNSITVLEKWRVEWNGDFYCLVELIERRFRQ